MTCSVVCHKATQGSTLLESGLDREAAIKAAARWYEHSLAFSHARLLASGVAVLVLPDEVAAQHAGTGIYIVPKEHVLYQAGSY